MPRYVALLRGVNVGGRNKLDMGELRALVEGLGHTEVTTFIQSGNLLLRTGRPLAASTVEAAIEARFGMRISVMLRTADELESVVQANPFATVDLSKVHVGFMAPPPGAGATAALDAAAFLPEELAVRGAELYLHLPNGTGRAKLPAYLERHLKVPTTIRRWSTVTKLSDLAGR